MGEQFNYDNNPEEDVVKFFFQHGGKFSSEMVRDFLKSVLQIATNRQWDNSTLKLLLLSGLKVTMSH